MPSGSCLCGDITYTYDVAPALTALCHCLDCQKWAGSGFSSNVALATTDLKITGSPKRFVSKADSGMDHARLFCGNCGTSLFAQPDSMQGTTLVKGGTLDDQDANIPIAVEFFNSHRRAFTVPVDGAKQLKAFKE